MQSIKKFIIHIIALCLSNEVCSVFSRFYDMGGLRPCDRKKENCTYSPVNEKNTLD